MRRNKSPIKTKILSNLMDRLSSKSPERSPEQQSGKNSPSDVNTSLNRENSNNKKSLSGASSSYQAKKAEEKKSYEHSVNRTVDDILGFGQPVVSRGRKNDTNSRAEKNEGNMNQKSSSNSRTKEGDLKSASKITNSKEQQVPPTVKQENASVVNSQSSNSENRRIERTNKPKPRRQLTMASSSVGGKNTVKATVIEESQRSITVEEKSLLVSSVSGKSFAKKNEVSVEKSTLPEILSAEEIEEMKQSRLSAELASAFRKVHSQNQKYQKSKYGERCTKACLQLCQTELQRLRVLKQTYSSNNKLSGSSINAKYYDNELTLTVMINLMRYLQQQQTETSEQIQKLNESINSNKGIQLELNKIKRQSQFNAKKLQEETKRLQQITKQNQEHKRTINELNQKLSQKQKELQRKEKEHSNRQMELNKHTLNEQILLGMFDDWDVLIEDLIHPKEHDVSGQVLVKSVSAGRDSSKRRRSLSSGTGRSSDSLLSKGLSRKGTSGKSLMSKSMEKKGQQKQLETISENKEISYFQRLKDEGILKLKQTLRSKSSLSTTNLGKEILRVLDHFGEFVRECKVQEGVILANLINENALIERQMEGQSKEMSKLQKSLESQKKRAEQLTVKLAEMEQEYIEKTKKFGVMEKEVEKLNKEIEKICERLEKQQINVKNGLQREKKLKEKNQELHFFEKQMEKYKKQLQRQNQRHLSDKQQQMKHLEKQIITLQREGEKGKIQLESAIMKSQSLSDKITELEETISEKKQKMVGLQKQLRQSQSESSKSHRKHTFQLQAVQKSLSKTQQALDIEENLHKAFKEKYETTNRELSQLRKELNDSTRVFDSKYKELQREYQQITEKHEKLSVEHLRVMNASTQVSVEGKEMEMRFRKDHQELKRLQIQRARFKSQVENLEQDNKRTGVECARLKEEIKYRNEKLNDMEREFSQYRKQAKQTEIALDKKVGLLEMENGDLNQMIEGKNQRIKNLEEEVLTVNHEVLEQSEQISMEERTKVFYEKISHEGEEKLKKAYGLEKYHIENINRMEEKYDGLVKDLLAVSLQKDQYAIKVGKLEEQLRQTTENVKKLSLYEEVINGLILASGYGLSEEIKSGLLPQSALVPPDQINQIGDKYDRLLANAKQSKPQAIAIRKASTTNTNKRRTANTAVSKRQDHTAAHESLLKLLNVFKRIQIRRYEDRIATQNKQNEIIELTSKLKETQQINEIFDVFSELFVQKLQQNSDGNARTKQQDPLFEERLNFSFIKLLLNQYETVVQKSSVSLRRNYPSFSRGNLFQETVSFVQKMIRNFCFDLSKCEESYRKFLENEQRKMDQKAMKLQNSLQASKTNYQMEINNVILKEQLKFEQQLTVIRNQEFEPKLAESEQRWREKFEIKESELKELTETYESSLKILKQQNETLSANSMGLLVEKTQSHQQLQDFKAQKKSMSEKLGGMTMQINFLNESKQKLTSQLHSCRNELFSLKSYELRLKNERIAELEDSLQKMKNELKSKNHDDHGSSHEITVDSCFGKHQQQQFMIMMGQKESQLSALNEEIIRQQKATTKLSQQFHQLQMKSIGQSHHISQMENKHEVLQGKHHELLQKFNSQLLSSISQQNVSHAHQLSEQQTNMAISPATTPLYPTKDQSTNNSHSQKQEELSRLNLIVSDLTDENTKLNDNIYLLKKYINDLIASLEENSFNEEVCLIKDNKEIEQLGVVMKWVVEMKNREKMLMAELVELRKGVTRGKGIGEAEFSAMVGADRKKIWQQAVVGKLQNRWDTTSTVGLTTTMTSNVHSKSFEILTALMGSTEEMLLRLAEFFKIQTQGHLSGHRASLQNQQGRLKQFNRLQSSIRQLSSWVLTMANPQRYVNTLESVILSILDIANKIPQEPNWEYKNEGSVSQDNMIYGENMMKTSTPWNWRSQIQQSQKEVHVHQLNKQENSTQNNHLNLNRGADIFSLRTAQKNSPINEILALSTGHNQSPSKNYMTRDHFGADGNELKNGLNQQMSQVGTKYEATKKLFVEKSDMNVTDSLDEQKDGYLFSFQKSGRE